jgi:hypothetical protein
VMDDNPHSPNCIPKFKSNIISEKETKLAWKNNQKNTFEDLEINGWENQTEHVQNTNIINKQQNRCNKPDARTPLP